MNLEELKAFLDQNRDIPEVRAFLAQYVKPELTPDMFAEFANTADGLRVIQPIIDNRVTGAVKTRDLKHEAEVENIVAQRLAAERLKMTPKADPIEQLRAELTAQLESERAARTKETIKRQLVEEAGKLGIPSLVDVYDPPSLDQGLLLLQSIKTYGENIAKRAANEGLSSTPKPGSGIGQNGMAIDLSKLTMQEAVALEESGELDKLLTKQG